MSFSHVLYVTVLRKTLLPDPHVNSFIDHFVQDKFRHAFVVVVLIRKIFLLLENTPLADILVLSYIERIQQQAVILYQIHMTWQIMKNLIENFRQYNAPPQDETKHSLKQSVLLMRRQYAHKCVLLSGHLGNRKFTKKRMSKFCNLLKSNCWKFKNCISKLW